VAIYGDRFTIVVRVHTEVRRTEMYVWINAKHDDNRLGLLFDDESGSVVLEGFNGGPVYGSPEFGRYLVSALNSERADERG